MILSLRHKGLKRLYEADDRTKVPAQLADKIALVLLMLDHAESPEQLATRPGFRLHPLKGDLRGHWSITISGNWRVTFRFQGTDVTDVDYLDYH